MSVFARVQQDWQLQYDTHRGQYLNRPGAFINLPSSSSPSSKSHFYVGSMYDIYTISSPFSLTSFTLHLGLIDLGLNWGSPGADYFQSSSNKELSPPLRVGYDKPSRCIALKLRIEHEGCYHALTTFRGEKLKNGEFTILVLNSEWAYFLTYISS